MYKYLYNKSGKGNIQPLFSYIQEVEVEKDVFALYDEVDHSVKIDRDNNEKCSPHCIYLTDARRYSGQCVLFKSKLKCHCNINGEHIVARCSECLKEF